MRYVSFLFGLVWLLASVVRPVSASETFKDEAGRIIYIIDENGAVSMFENSPGIDITLSVTRGTREQMQPQITELAPESVTAGTNTMLRLKGKNLVGATVKFSEPGIEVGTYSGKPKSLDVPIRIPVEVPPGPVTVELSTPIGMGITASALVGSRMPRDAASTSICANGSGAVSASSVGPSLRGRESRFVS